jgi:hypothetical protein
MVSIGMRVDTADNKRLVVLHPVPAVLSIRAGGPVGKGGQKSDEALSRAGSYQVTRRPTRPPRWAISGGQPSADKSHERHQEGQFMRRSDPRPDA